MDHHVVVPTLIVLVGTLVAWFSIRRILSLQSKSYPSWRKVTERIVLSLVALIAVIVAGNSEFDAIVSRANNPPGAMYRVNGHKMRIDCTGSGSPTIVLDAGLGNDGLIWSRVQPVLAKTTRVCSYDRAGFGWSEPQPGTQDADHMAVELHGLLMAAKIDGPIVLMGHSIAGLYIRDYATRYPAAIAGLIFVDASTPLQDRNPAWNPPAEGPAARASWRRELFWYRAAFRLGIPRLFGACPGSFPGFGLRTALLQLENLCHEHLEAYVGEWENFDRSGEETVHTGPYGALPILIFSRDTANNAWNQMQENLKKLSTRSRRIVARGSGHLIQTERPGLVEKEVRLFIEQIRGTAPEPTDYGSTTIE